MLQYFKEMLVTLTIFVNISPLFDLQSAAHGMQGRRRSTRGCGGRGAWG
jgi:hypothetical protein